jgi:hypothetical protein
MVRPRWFRAFAAGAWRLIAVTSHINYICTQSDQNQKQNPVVLKVSSCTIVSSCPLVLDVAIWINPAQNSTSDHLTLTDFCHPCTGDRQDALINLNDPYETEHESDVSNSQKRRSH